MRISRQLFTCTLGVLLIAAGSAVSADTEDPFLGDWEGGWSTGGKGRPGGVVAQVIPRGEGKYVINFLPEFDMRCPPFAQVEGRVKGGELVFDAEGWSGSAKGDKLTGKGMRRDEEAPFALKKVTRLSPRLGAEAPEGAVLLFDGSNLDHWEMVANKDGATGPVTWKIEDGVMVVEPEVGDHKIGLSLGTKKTWSDFKLHLEFQLPLYPDRTGQERGNSGVIIEDYPFYEIQVLDTYGLPGYYNECGGIYKVAGPKMNMCAPPLQWQSYEIEFHGARFDDAGRVTALPWVTVEHNGKLIHKMQELPFTEGAQKMRLEKPGLRKPGRIKLQDHGYPVRYRNIWLLPLVGGH